VPVLALALLVDLPLFEDLVFDEDVEPDDIAVVVDGVDDRLDPVEPLIPAVVLSLPDEAVDD